MPSYLKKLTFIGLLILLISFTLNPIMKKGHLFQTQPIISREAAIKYDVTEYFAAPVKGIAGQVMKRTPLTYTVGFCSLLF